MDLHDLLPQIPAPPQSAPLARVEAISPLQALKTLNESVTESLLACIKGQPEQAGQHLVTALPQLLLAMSVLGVDPTYPQPVESRLIYIEGNRVEVRVDGELRGSWSIWSVADLKEVCRLAEEFDCGLVYSLIGSLSPSRGSARFRSLVGPSLPSFTSDRPKP